MKVKEIDRTATIAWSPPNYESCYIAAGTAAQQLDATFSTAGSFEIFDLALNKPGLDMTLKGSIASDYRFHRVAWGRAGMKSFENVCGLLVGGADDGNILMYDPIKIISGEDALVCHKTNHSGPVRSLDFNKFQDCLLASGAGDSEIFIWDLNNLSNPMTPGAKLQPLQDVRHVAWNNQVQHILASTFAARCVVWDLKKKDPVMKISDSTLSMSHKVVAWHPENATQLCLSSDDDFSCVIQLWDLRFATIPVRNFKRHQKGILSLAWCMHDSDMMISCGKDNILVCWNPNSNVEHGDILCELNTNREWSFDVAWCLKNPAVIACSSCDGFVTAYSITSGFDSCDNLPKGARSFSASNDQMSSQKLERPSYLKKAPKWFKRLHGASFGPGGQLVSFSSPSNLKLYKPDAHGSINILQVVTEPKFLEKVTEFESACSTGNFVAFCQERAESADDNFNCMCWKFIEGLLKEDQRKNILEILGYDPDASSILSGCLEFKVSKEDNISKEHHDLGKMLEMVEPEEHLFVLPEEGGSPIQSDENVKRISSEADGTGIRYSFLETDNNDPDGKINEALLRGNIYYAVDLCISNERWADAVILAEVHSQGLLEKVRKLYFESVQTNSTQLISVIATRNWRSFIENCDITNWKEALAAIFSYADNQKNVFSYLCGKLGKRMQISGNETIVPYAALCYICCNDLETLATLSLRTRNLQDTMQLEAFVEQALILHMNVLSNTTAAIGNCSTGNLDEILKRFTELLCSQGMSKSAAMFNDIMKKNLDVVSSTSLANSEDVQHSSHETGDSSTILTSQETFIPENGSGSSITDEHTLFYPQQQYQTFDYSQQAYFAHPGLPQQPMSFGPPPTSSYSATSTILSPPPTGISNVFDERSMSSQRFFQRYPRYIEDPCLNSQSTYQGDRGSLMQDPYLPPFTATSHVSSVAHPFTSPSQFSCNTQSSTAVNSQWQSTYMSVPTTNFGNVVTQQPSVYFAQGPFGTASNYPQHLHTEQNNSPFTSIYTAPYYGPNRENTPQVSFADSADALSSTYMHMQPLTTAHEEIKSGWNDPPTVNLVKASGIYNTPTAITTPLPYTSASAYSSSFGPPNVVDGSTEVKQYQSNVLPSQFEELPNILNESMKVPFAEEKNDIKQISREPDPFPPEHQVIFDTLEGLLHKCYGVSMSSQMKRKLEDISKKLETLYNDVREKSLSESVMKDLHQMMRLLAIPDFAGAASMHKVMVESANFSEISGFMPSVKVLIQTAWYLLELK